jgi:subtilisin family serine protease
LDRVDQRGLPLDNAYSYDSTASGVHAYVIDTGIRISHNEFGGRASYGWNFFDNNPIAEDCYTDVNGNPRGHGTHVAGILGSNTYGVAKGVRLVAAKVFGCSGLAATSTIVAGINWVAANAIKPAVIDMSIGSSCDPAHPCTDDNLNAVATAINNSIDSELTFVVSAGNQNVDACTGLFSRTPRAITVGAPDINDVPATYSNDGQSAHHTLTSSAVVGVGSVAGGSWAGRVPDRWRAALTRPTWLNACGVLPSCRRVAGSYSSDSSPSSLRKVSSRSNSSWASRSRPMPNSASASQKVQVINAPSVPGSPSTLPSACGR